MRVHQTSDLHRQIEKLPRIERFLSSLKRNSLSTSNGYKTSIAYFHEFSLRNYNQTADSILQMLDWQRSRCIFIIGLVYRFRAG